MISVSVGNVLCGKELFHVLVDQLRVVLLHPVTAIRDVPRSRNIRCTCTTLNFEDLNTMT